MATLKSRTRNLDLVRDLTVADGFFSRGWGLLGHDHLDEDEAMWIVPGNSIHTFFMRFPIDCVFVDRDLRVVSLIEDVRPWRMIWPVRKASSVIEMKAGSIARLSIAEGEELHVGA